MKAYKPGTDCQVELCIFANGKPCSEYCLPGHDDEPNASVCYIPVTDNDTITVHGTFTGSVLFGRIDMLADGAFVATRSIEDHRSKEGVLRYWDKRKVDIKTCLQIPDLNDHKPRLRPKVVEGNLITSRLKGEDSTGPLHGGEFADGIGVGSIALIVSLNQEVFDTYESEVNAAYSNFTLGSWRSSYDNVAKTALKPDFELAMDIFPDSNPVKDKRATLFYRDAKLPRPGSEAWTCFVFYYRTQAAIDAAGCLPLTKSKRLPADGGLFTKASEQDVVMAHSVTDVLPVLPPAPEPTLQPAPAPTAKKRMGVGQALCLTGGDPTKSPSAQDTGTTTSNKIDVYSLSGSADASREGTPGQGTVQGINHSLNPGSAFTTANPSLLPRLDNDAPDSRTLNPHAPTSDYLDTSIMDFSMMSDEVHLALSEYQADDLASPSLPSHGPESSKAESTPSVSETLNIYSLPQGSDGLKSASQEPPRKRPALSTGSNSATPTSMSTVSSPPPAKRARNEELQRRKAQLELTLKTKRERKAAMQKKLEDDIAVRAEQQQRWAEEAARRREEEEARQREEEERRRLAQEEEEARLAEEALMAEMEALERDNELEDADVARLAEEDAMRLKQWEEIVKAREQAE